MNGRPEPTLAEQLTQLTVDRIAAETDRWCWKAIAAGVGWRVWRSEGRIEGDPGTLNYRHVHEFQLLPPGAPPPASGTIFGPFSKPTEEG